MIRPKPVDDKQLHAFTLMKYLIIRQTLRSDECCQ